MIFGALPSEYIDTSGFGDVFLIIVFIVLFVLYVKYDFGGI
tara:strand:- start:750 stop:872 length:123 start_codon:yes stop_codon:yes gene_type:complete